MQTVSQCYRSRQRDKYFNSEGRENLVRCCLRQCGEEEESDSVHKSPVSGCDHRACPNRSPPVTDHQIVKGMPSRAISENGRGYFFN